MNLTDSDMVVFRRAGLSRINDLVALEEASFESDRISRRNLRNLLRSPTAFCLGAYRQGELVGSLIVLFRRNSRSARIYSIAVSPQARGLGIARSMMNRVEREARRRGCVRIRLEVRMENIPAIRLYEAFGYRGVQVVPGYYEDGAHAMVYRKELE